jgi:hypothetical protein
MLSRSFLEALPMTPETAAWVEGLRAHAIFARPAGALHGPLSGPIGGPPAAAIAAERAVLAASLAAWLDTTLPGLLAERAAEAKAGGHEAGSGLDAEPAIVITTTPAGCGAATDLLDRNDPLMRQLRGRVACVTELEYRRFCMQHPDEDYRLHIAHWSWMKTHVPEPWWPRFARWPLHAGECYWLHRTGTAGAGREQRSSHLWKWNGTTASILRPFVDERVPTA